LGESFGRRGKLVSVGESEKGSTKKKDAVSFDVNLMTTLSRIPQREDSEEHAKETLRKTLRKTLDIHEPMKRICL